MPEKRRPPLVMPPGTLRPGQAGGKKEPVITDLEKKIADLQTRCPHDKKWIPVIKRANIYDPKTVETDPRYIPTEVLYVVCESCGLVRMNREPRLTMDTIKK